MSFRLYAVTDRRMCSGEAGLVERLAALCAGGLKGAMIREKDLDEGKLYDLAIKCGPLFSRYGASWFVNGSVEVARRAGATGVHLAGTQDVARARAELGPRFLVGKSVHGVGEAVAASEAGADFLLFGPVYATPAKAGFGPPQGAARLREVCGAVACPVFAVGGVTPDRVAGCLEAGAGGVAAISSLMGSEDPSRILANYERELQRL